MGIVYGLLRDYASRLDRRGRRILVFLCALAMTLYARTTVAAVHDGQYADMAAGVVLLVVVAAVSAMAWSAPRRAARPRRLTR
jgi:hypothetical protein